MKKVSAILIAHCLALSSLSCRAKNSHDLLSVNNSPVPESTFSPVELLFLAMNEEVIREEQVGELVSQANSCLSAAFARAGYPGEAVVLEFRGLQVPTQPNPATWNLQPWDMAVDEKGQAFPDPSCETNRFKVFLGAPAQARLYGKKNSTDEQLLQEWSYIRRVLEGICLDGISQGCEKPSETEKRRLDARLASIFPRVMKLPNVPAVWMDKPENSGSNPSILFVHEFMHAWGGLDDRYHNPEAFDQTNLMGPTDSFTCKLDKHQVQAIQHYRSNCVKENLGNLRELPGGRRRLIPKPTGLSKLPSS